MQENYDLVQRGFRILLGSLSGFIGQELNKVYRDKWWAEVLYVLNDPRELPIRGSYGDLIDSLDIANCIRLIDREWNEVFKNVLSLNCRTWSKELMGIRNIVAHIGSQDLEQPTAERALDTMVLLCDEIDIDSADEIREIYKIVRAKANDQTIDSDSFTGLEQPKSDSKRGALKDGSLLQMVGTDIVQKTTLTRKVTYSGKTVIYPVYRVRLDALFYNNQNDRIATWITRYESENGAEALTNLNQEIYNRIIENFIYDSNPDAIQKTQKNISLVGQREPGVTLADGRIVDGNRRYTCLRRLQRMKSEPLYFETVIMDMDIREDKKQIKLLELAIQHGEEKKVDYDLIDYAIGTYRDVIETNLLTVQEYAESTNETLATVKKRIEIAKVICEFLDYLKLPKQYHVARDYQVYSLFQEMTPLLKKLDEDEQVQLKTIAFNNAMMKAIPDQRKFIRDIKSLINKNAYNYYFEDQKTWSQIIKEKYDKEDIRNKEDIDNFADNNLDITEELKNSMDKALFKYRSLLLKNRPSENVSKSIELLTQIDSRLFKSLEKDEKDDLLANLDELAKMIEYFQKMLAR